MGKIGRMLLGMCCFVLLAAGFFGVTTSSTTGEFTGSLSQYLQLQETSLTTQFNSGYTKLYAEFSKSGLTILKSVEYQSLICLGVLPVESLLSLLQKDKLSLKIAMNKDLSELGVRVNALEEKNRLQIENGVSLFDGSSYEEEKMKLKATIDVTVATQKKLIQSYVSGYTLKIKSFFSDFTSYSKQNSGLIKNISAKIIKVQNVGSGFVTLENKLIQMYKAMGIWELISKFETIKDLALRGLSTQLDTVIASKLKIYAQTPGLSGELAVQKVATLNQYKLDMDERLSAVFQKWYDRAGYLKLKGKIALFQEQYFTGQTLVCSAIVGNDDAAIHDLLKQIAVISSGVNKSIISASSSGNQASIKQALLAAFKGLYTKNALRQKVLKFQNGVRTFLTTLQSFFTPTQEPDAYTLPIGFVFSRPLVVGKIYSEVEILQKFLANKKLYTGAIGAIFTQQTKDALYAFQLQQGILTTSSDPALHGLLGPVTRKLINSLLK